MNLLNLILSAVLSGIMSYVAIVNISGKTKNLKSFISYLLIFLPLLFIPYIFFSDVTKLILSILFIIISLYFSIFKKDISNSVYYTIVYELLVFICEIIISVVFVSIFKINISGYEKFQFSLLIFSICNCLMVYLLSKIKVLNKSIQKLNLIISKNQKDWVYIIIIIILLSFLIVFNKNNLGSGINYYINAGMVIFIIASFVYVIYNKFQMQAIEDKYNESMEYVLRYEKIINEQGKKNHEYNNQLMVIKGYINKPERLSEYLYVDQNLKDKDIESFDLKTYRDLTKLLGVFLDNAIDAALKSEEKEIEVELKDKDDCLLLTISNTYDKNTDINKVGKSGFTTKGVGHGFGLSIVKDIAKTNSEIETFSSKESDKFIQTAMIYFKK